MNQGPAPPFDPRAAVRKFAGVLKTYGLAKVTGDAYAGQTFRLDFEQQGITYAVASGTTSDHYEALEPKINAGEIALLDVPTLTEKLVGLVMRGSKVTHASGEHDDFACVVAGVVHAVAGPKRTRATWGGVQPAPAPQKPAISEPEILAALTAMGDEYVADYRTGRLTRAEAAAMVARGAKNIAAMRAGPVTMWRKP